MDKNRPWGIHTLRDMLGSDSDSVSAGLPDGRWVRAIPEPYSANRLVAAWWVLKGRAYAILWPKHGDLEAALGVPERKKPWPSEGERSATAAATSAHLPKPDAFNVVSFSEEDVEALRAAFKKRFNEDIPRTETLFCVASIGYRMALRDLAAQKS